MLSNGWPPLTCRAVATYQCVGHFASLPNAKFLKNTVRVLFHRAFGHIQLASDNLVTEATTD